MKYKNVSMTTQELIGYGVVVAGAVIETSEPLHNPNFQEVVEPKESKKEVKK